ALLQSDRWMSLMVSIANPLITRLNDKPRFEGEELVVVAAPFFSHRLVKGYASPTLEVVEKLNGVTVKNLTHLAELLHDCQDEYLEFKFAGNRVETLVFRRRELADATEEILNDNGIRNQCSDDLSAIWKK